MSQLSIYSELHRAASTAPDGFPDRSESKAAHLARLVFVISNQISDPEWDKLSLAAQEWQEEAAKVVNENAEIADCPGYDDFDASSAVDEEEPEEDDDFEDEEPEEDDEDEEEEEAKVRKPAKKAVKQAKPKKVEKPVETKEKPAKAAKGPKKPSKLAEANAERKARLAEKKATVPKKEKAAKPAKEKVVPIKKEKAPSMMSAIREIMVRNSDYNTNDLRAALVKQGWDDTKIKQNILSVSCGDAKNLIKLARELGYWNDKPVKNVS